MRLVWVVLLAALAVPLGTCSTVPGSCRTMTPPPRLAACLVPEGGWSAVGARGPGDAYSVSLAARVATAGDGLPPDGCFDAGAVVGALPHAADAVSMWWFRAADAWGQSWTVGALVPALPRPVLPGQQVSTQYQWSSGGFSPTRGALELRDGGGALLLWIGQGGDIPDLALPAELAALGRGKPRCQERESCGTWRGHDLTVSTGAARATVRYGQEAVVGGLRLVHGGYELASAYRDCADWYVASIIVAAMPAEPTPARTPASRPAPTAWLAGPRARPSTAPRCALAPPGTYCLGPCRPVAAG